jgi:2-hydroxy-6-oxonona-2,4-dienedioate hydrolase
MHVRVARSDHGRRTVILVHGLVVSGRYMQPLAERLAADYHVYIPDLPGFGLSPAQRVLEVPELADALAGWMVDSGHHPASLIGNSLGCQIIVETAARYPALVERLVLVAPTPDRTRKAVRHALGLVLDLLREPPSLLPIMCRDLLDAGLPRFFCTANRMFRHRAEHLRSRVRAPVLVIRGARDPIVSPRWAEAICSALPEGRLVTVPGSAHATHYSSPVAVARLIRAFLQEEA